MRHATILGIFTVMLTLITGLVFAEHVIDDSKEPRYLFVISGTSGSLDGDTLTLNGVPNVIYFSDRPARIAGHISLEKFVYSWNKGSDSFKADPPCPTSQRNSRDSGVLQSYSDGLRNRERWVIRLMSRYLLPKSQMSRL